MSFYLKIDLERRERFQDSDSKTLSLAFVGDAETYRPDDVRTLGMNDDFKTVLNYLWWEKLRSPTLRSAWNTAEAKLIQDGIIENTNDNVSCAKVAVLCYTLDTPNFFSKFNAKCRQLNRESWKHFPYKSIWILLRHASRFAQIRSNPVIDKNTQLYRGVRSHIALPTVGDQVYSKQYLSFTKNIDIALDFLENETPKSTMFILKGKPITGKGIVDYSVFENEEEVLITPFEYFRVKEVDTSKDRHIIILEAEP